MVGLLDTSILVDIIRDHIPALDWLQTQAPLGITPIVAMELVAGAQNKAAQKIAMNLIDDFPLVFLTESDMRWAMGQHLDHVLSHTVGMMDCLIASVNLRLNLPLYTANLKHFTPLLGNLAQKPY